MIAKIKLRLNCSLIIVLCGVVILFLTSWAPFMVGNPMGTDLQRRIINYSLWLFAGLALLIGPKAKTFSPFEIIAIIAVLVYRACNIFHAYDYKGIGLTTIFIGVFFCYQTDEVRADVFDCFKKIIVFISAIGIVLYFAHIIGLSIPYSYVDRGGGIGWLNYKICYLMNDRGSIRLCGLFEEPGWYGTWAAFFLCAEDLNFRNTGNIILLIAGFLTLSLAFFLLVIAYYVLTNLSEWKRWLLLIILALLYLFVLPVIKTGNASIDHILQRMVITKNGLAGSNRYGSVFKQLYDKTVHSNKVFFGYGAGYAEIFGTADGSGLASIKSYIVNFGIIGTLVIHLPIFIASVRQSLLSKNKRMLFYVLISFISLYQRPYLFWTPHFIMFICGISYTALFDINRRYLVKRHITFNRMYLFEAKL